MIKALIFDLDGTLANTELLHYRAWRQTLLKNGVEEFSFDDFRFFIGTSNEKVAGDYIKRDNIQKEISTLVLEKQVLYLDLIPEIELFPDVAATITQFYPDYRLALASSSHKKEIDAIVTSHNLADFFELIVGGDMVKHKKPAPEIYLKVQQTLGVNSDECIAFEDSEHGLNSAKNAGLYGVAIPNEFTQHHDFSRADLILKNLRDMDNEKILAIGSVDSI